MPCDQTMNSLRAKLAFGYGLMILVLFAVSAWSIHHLVRLGRAIDVILVNNYQSVIAAENMKEELEREDSAALFFIAGHPEKARQQFADASRRFDEQFQVAANNITEPGEAEIIADSHTQYVAYHTELEGFLNLPARPKA